MIIDYKVYEGKPESLNDFEKYSQKDYDLLGGYKINSSFDQKEDVIELHIYSKSGQLLESSYDYRKSYWTKSSEIYLNPERDVVKYTDSVDVLYNFYRNPFGKNSTFFISDISSDRTELKVKPVGNYQESGYSNIKKIVSAEGYFSDFRINFKNNDLLIGINIEKSPDNYFFLKLYEPLPSKYGIKDVFFFCELIADSVLFRVEPSVVESIKKIPYLKGPNFNIETEEEVSNPTQYLSYNDLFSYPITGSNFEIFSTATELGASLGINYEDYSNFINYSSAEERLRNFQYKLQLIESYNNNITIVSDTGTNTTGSVSYYQNLIQGVVSNFDSYESFLYFESSSKSWPKSNNSRPYENQLTSESEAILWFAENVSSASLYDSTNPNILINSIPSYIREDSSNDPYILFVNMIGQHFDNIWVYVDAMSSKYNGDNRVNYGLSKDLVGEVLKNFGVKLYSSNTSTGTLYSMFIGEEFPTGSDVINSYKVLTSGSSLSYLQPMSKDLQQKEIYKRLYHNLPLLLKSKGTERGLKALISCFGIPSTVLNIRYRGGVNTESLPYISSELTVTSSLDKIRLDNTGSIVGGSTLSSYTSIVKRSNKYTDDTHVLEVGFSPTEDLNNVITHAVTASFNIDDYIGDPRQDNSSNYPDLIRYSRDLLGDLGSHNLKDYIRLLQFYDNSLFKMVKDFVPARSNAEVGVIIKPNLLQRSKAKKPQTSIDTSINYSGSIDIISSTGSDGGSFGSRNQYTSSYTEQVTTKFGIATRYDHNHEEAKLNGEFRGSHIIMTSGSLTLTTIPNYTPISYIVSSAAFEPTPTYNIIANLSTATNSDTITYTLVTEFVDNGTFVDYTASLGGGILVTDFTPTITTLTGSFEVGTTDSISYPVVSNLLNSGSITLALGDYVISGVSKSVSLYPSASLAASYSLSSSKSSVDEGQSFTIYLLTENGTVGTSVPYTITGVSGSDIGGASLTGNFVVGSIISKTFNVTADSTTEGTETFTLTLDSITPTVSKNVTINDTSVESYTPLRISSSIDNTISKTWTVIFSSGSRDVTQIMSGATSGVSGSLTVNQSSNIDLDIAYEVSSAATTTVEVFTYLNGVLRNTDTFSYPSNPFITGSHTLNYVNEGDNILVQITSGL